MTKVEISPGICGFTAKAAAESEDQMEVTLHVESGCMAVTKMMEELGNVFDAFDVCLKRPGENLFYEYAAKHFPGHGSCPVIAGICKCIEVECRLALPHNAEIKFE